MAKEYLDKEGLMRLVELLEGEMSELKAKIDEVKEALDNVDHSEYVKITDVANYGNITEKTRTNKFLSPYYIDKIWKVGATTNTETWTDTEKASACETIGAVAKATDTSTQNRIYGVAHSGTKTALFPAQSGGINQGTIPMRNANGQFDVGTPQYAVHCANKGYVDGLIEELRAEIDALKNG